MSELRPAVQISVQSHSGYLLNSHCCVFTLIITCDVRTTMGWSGSRVFVMQGVLLPKHSKLGEKTSRGGGGRGVNGQSRRRSITPGCTLRKRLIYFTTFVWFNLLSKTLFSEMNFSGSNQETVVLSACPLGAILPDQEKHKEKQQPVPPILPPIRSVCNSQHHVYPISILRCVLSFFLRTRPTLQFPNSMQNLVALEVAVP